MDISLGDSLTDFRQLYVDELKKMAYRSEIKRDSRNGIRLGQVATASKGSPPSSPSSPSVDTSWHLEVHAGLDARIYHIVVRQTRWRLVEIGRASCRERVCQYV